MNVCTAMKVESYRKYLGQQVFIQWEDRKGSLSLARGIINRLDHQVGTIHFSSMGNRTPSLEEDIPTDSIVEIGPW